MIGGNAFQAVWLARKVSRYLSILCLWLKCVRDWMEWSASLKRTRSGTSSQYSWSCSIWPRPKSNFKYATNRLQMGWNVSEVECIQAGVDSMFVIHLSGDHQFLQVLAWQCEQPTTLPCIRHRAAETSDNDCSIRNISSLTYYYYTRTRLTASFPGHAGSRKVKPVCI